MTTRPLKPANSRKKTAPKKTAPKKTAAKAKPSKTASTKASPYGDDEQRLAGAADSGDCKTLRALLARGVDANTRDPQAWYTPLYIAASQGHVEAVKLLLAAGADVGAKIRNAKSTPLDAAASEGHVAVVEVLLAAGAPLGQPQGRFGWTALHNAAVSGHEQVIKMLLGAGMSVDTPSRGGVTPLATALFQGEKQAWDVLPMLLAAGADIKRVSKEILKDEKYASLRPLFVKYGLPEPAKKKETAKAGSTPLHEAAARGQLDVVKQLLAAGAQVGAKIRSTKTTPLHLAAAGNHVEVIDVLIAAGAPLTLFHGPWDWTPLHEAVAHGHKEATQRLLAAGLDVNIKHEDGASPLLTALHYKDAWGVLPILLAAGADAAPALSAVQHVDEYASLRPLFRKYAPPARKKK